MGYELDVIEDWILTAEFRTAATTKKAAGSAQNPGKLTFINTHAPQQVGDFHAMV